MKYALKHITTYGYGAPVPFSRCLLRVLPINTAGQTVEDAQVQLEPMPDIRHEEVDFFGNRLIRADFSQAHQRLIITTTARVHVHDAHIHEHSFSPPWEQVRFSAQGMDMSASSPVHGLFASRLVPLSLAALDYALLSFPENQAVLTAVLHLTRRIYTDFTYDAQATDVSTPLDAALAARRGVCQDFAHILLACVRGMGLSARYVSGYLRTIPPAGQPRLEGADATHAWVEVWCGQELGWVGFDPTNGILSGHSHIVLARGRDYADVPPLEGIVVLASDRWLKVSVDVEEIEGAP